MISPRRLRSVLAVLAGLVMASASACAAGTAAGSPVAEQGPFARDPVTAFVKADGRQFTVDGRPFRFTGVNIYDAAATDRYSCDPGARMTPAELRSTLQALHDRYGASVVRFWAYQTYTDGGRFFDGVDQVIAAARDVGVRVLPVLEDGPGYCTTSPTVTPKAEYRNDSWFTDGYRSPYGDARLSFRDYARVMAEHYRDEPDILGWSLVNEADTSARDAQGRSVLIGFAEDVGSVVRAADPHHLITLGTQGNGARGASGPDFLAVYQVPELDFAEVHDWGYWGSDSEPMPGGSGSAPPAPISALCQQSDAPVGCSFAFASRLGKPLFVGEAGISGTTAGERTTRATQLGAKMDAAFAAGAGGYLLWRITRQRTDKYDITLGDGDPLLDQLALRSKSID